MTKIACYIFLPISFMLLACLPLQAQPLSDSLLAAQPVYTSIEQALTNPQQVYRLRLKGNLKSDSLPESIFQLENLQELTLKGCRLQLLNTNITKLSHLQYLNLEHNHLVRLPETLCDLPELRTLIINRNMISSLPNAIGKMKKLEVIEAWDNPLYVLPNEIVLLSETLQVIDLRQIGFRKYEIEQIVALLPKTNILYSNLCECKNGRD